MHVRCPRPRSFYRELALLAVAALAAPTRAQSALFSDDVHRVAPANVAYSTLGPFASGDFDQDGDVDVATARELLSNDGYAVFTSSPCAYPGSAWKRSVAIGDVDGDHDLDILGDTSLLWLNDGAGCFVEASNQLPSTSASGLSGFGVLGDVDGDGDLDCVVGTLGTDCADDASCVSSEVRVYRNDGAGVFSDAGPCVDPLALGHARAFALDDVDADGDLDLFIANTLAWGLTVPCGVLLNDGLGVFASSASDQPFASTSEGSAKAAFSDLDGDGDPDLVFSTGYLWLNRGGGEFSDATHTLGRSGNSSFAALGDVEGDGDVDLIRTTAEGADELLRNDGHGAFTHEPEAFALKSLYARFELADLDSDGDLDALAERDALEVHLYDGGGAFVWRAPLLPSRGASSSNPLVGDVDGDTDVDVYESGYGHDQLLSNDGSGAYVDASRNVPHELDRGHDAAFADVEGDGDLDLFVVNGNTGFEPPAESRLLLNDGLGRFAAAPAQWSAPDDAFVRVLCGDLDGDQAVDVLGLSAGWRRTRAYFNDGFGHFAPRAGTGPDLDWDAYDGELADFDGDGDLDAVWGGQGARVFSNDGAGKLVAGSTIWFAGLLIRDVATLDVEGDGDVDLAVAIANQSVWRLLNDGHGNFTKSAIGIGPATVATIASGDVDDDGDADLLLCSDPSSQQPTGLSLFTNDGAGQFTDATAKLPTVPFGGGALSLADTDEDGDLDALVAASSARSRLLVNLTRHLAWHAPPRIGEPIVFDVWGAPNQSFALLGATERKREPLGALGVLQLERATIFERSTGALDATGHAQIAVDVPGGLALAGRSLYWQVLLRSPDRLTNLEITTFDPDSLH
ncbi:MAG: VCBS repeat-containing protein [Planctomycetes bacterium]|nr:VCBS repeat-containing protein [Planctomycetota bacterium]